VLELLFSVPVFFSPPDSPAPPSRGPLVFVDSDPACESFPPLPAAELARPAEPAFPAVPCELLLVRTGVQAAAIKMPPMAAATAGALQTRMVDLPARQY
jgi:hypothetical protein